MRTVRVDAGAELPQASTAIAHASSAQQAARSRLTLLAVACRSPGRVVTLHGMSLAPAPASVIPAPAERRRRLARLWPPAAGARCAARRLGTGHQALNVSPEILPGPRLVASASWADRANLGAAMWTTTREALLGILLATACAAALAVAIDWSRTVRRSLYPLLLASQTLPIIVLAPLVVIWFGFGNAPKVGARRALHVLPDRRRRRAGPRGGRPRIDGSAAHDGRDATPAARSRPCARRARAFLHRPEGRRDVRLRLGDLRRVRRRAAGSRRLHAVGEERASHGTGLRRDHRHHAAHAALLFGGVALLERAAMPWRRPPTADAVW